MAEVDGATLVARSLKRQGVRFMFGIVGFPVGPIAVAAQKEGITYVGMRNEQSASYAAQAVGYLTGRPGACLVVSGPGVVHALAGLANAQQNGWPMICIGGASESWRNGMGAFQEERQVLITTPFCKFSHAVEHVHRIPFYVEMAVRNAIYGRPGASYLDMPDDITLGLRMGGDYANNSPLHLFPVTFADDLDHLLNTLVFEDIGGVITLTEIMLHQYGDHEDPFD